MRGVDLSDLPAWIVPRATTDRTRWITHLYQIFQATPRSRQQPGLWGDPGCEG